MLTTTVDFVRLLRRHGLRVSPAESLDAARALDAVGLRERGLAREALRATLVKEPPDQALFDSLFDTFFGLHPATPQPTAGTGLGLPDHDHDSSLPTRLELGEDLDADASPDHDHTHGEDEAMDLRRLFEEGQLRPTPDLHGDADRLRVSLFAQELILNRRRGGLDEVLQRITHQIRLRRAHNVFNPGGLAPASSAEELPLDITATELEDLIEHLEELEVPPELLEALMLQADRVLEGLPEMIQAMLERQRRLEPQAAALAERSLRRLLAVSPVEQRELEAAVRRLAREIHGAQARRLRSDRVGRISAGRTLRRNLRYDGVPFEPVLRRRREQRPRLVVLCDVSLSTRNLARFWLQLVHQMQSLFSKVRTYVFVAELVEVTALLEEDSLDRAVASIFGGRLLDVDASSDFGRVAARFRDSELERIGGRTTVVVLGDARNNGRPPQVEALQAIAERARRLIWLTPEPRYWWPLGTCDLALYEPCCERVWVVRDLDQLRGLAQDLVRERGRRSGAA